MRAGDAVSFFANLRIIPDTESNYALNVVLPVNNGPSNSYLIYKLLSKLDGCTLERRGRGCGPCAASAFGAWAGTW